MSIACAETLWKLDILVADIEELDASACWETQCGGDYNGEKWFPIADGTLKLSGGDQDNRKSILKKGFNP